jgi:uncharacterized membrane protein YbhN (UPF0104 family)
VLVSVGFSAGLLALVLHLAAAARGPEGGAGLSEVLRAVRLPLVAAYAGLQLCAILLRSERYRILLRGGGEAETPGRLPIALVTAARNMFVDLLPARVGELSYVALLNRGYGVSARTCISSLGISVLFDMVALLVVMAAVSAAPLLTPGFRRTVLGGLAALALIAVAGWWVLFNGVRGTARLLHRFVSPVAGRAPLRRLLALADELAEAVETTRRAGVLARTFWLSLGVRTCKYAGLYAVFLAVTMPALHAVGNASLGQVLAALLAAEGFASLPIPSFMGFGTYESGGTLALAAFGLSAGAAATAMLATHVVSQIVDYSLGLLGLLGLGFLGRGVGARASRILKVLSVLVVVAAVSVAGFLVAQDRARWRAAQKLPETTGAGVAVPAGDLDGLRSILDGQRGFLVWSSNRFGTHDILRMDLPSGEIVRLTSEGHTDTYPRISPDGKRVVFCRSQVPWVSQRDSRRWDTWVVDLAGGGERLVAHDANAPSWSADGRRIVFQRAGGSVVAHDLASGAEEVLFRAGTRGLPEGVELSSPDLHPNSGTLAVTLRGRRMLRMTALLPSSGGYTRVAGGCQLTWSRGGSFLFLVDSGGRQENAIWRLEPGGTPVRWLDLPGEHSHEYFPRETNDGRFLVLGASTGGDQHEHDKADYEIYLWRIGSPAADAARLTHHTGNDNWPDVYLFPAGR